ncbi:MAG: hypothetical protein LC792_10915 [Actinobacteria bacterium]|nr:hypothetical protein [Actinomycetota bacterium]
MLMEWRRDPMAALSWMSALPADVSAPRFGYPMRIVLDPAVAGEVLVADAGSYTRPRLVTSTMRDGLGPTLFTSDGAEVIAQRGKGRPQAERGHGTQWRPAATLGELWGPRPRWVCRTSPPRRDVEVSWRREARRRSEQNDLAMRRSVKRAVRVIVALAVATPAAAIAAGSSNSWYGHSPAWSPDGRQLAFLRY